MTDGSSHLSSGMIGLGNMGGRIARRIRDAAMPIRGFDVSEEQVATAGIAGEASIGALAGAADVVFLSLPDSPVIESVVFGDGGLASTLRQGQIVVDLARPLHRRPACASTIGWPRRARRFSTPGSPAAPPRPSRERSR